MSRVLPILFNTDMVRAILDGRKTVTRRIIKQDKVTQVLSSPARANIPDIPDKKFIECLVDTPYEPGDILYVRETWRPLSAHPNARYEYAANWSAKYFDNSRNPESVNNGKWHPSIHMPKRAARIWLKVTDVRAERLQDITESQATEEGISRLYDDLSDAEYIDWAKRTGVYPKAKGDWGYKNYLWHGNFGKAGTGNWKSDNWDYQYSSYDNAVDSFSSLWNSTLKKSDLDRYGWAANPWVWVIEFERCEKPENL